MDELKQQVIEALKKKDTFPVAVSPEELVLFEGNETRCLYVCAKMVGNSMVLVSAWFMRNTPSSNWYLYDIILNQ